MTNFNYRIYPDCKNTNYYDVIGTGHFINEFGQICINI
jgi:hypothetical protein